MLSTSVIIKSVGILASVVIFCYSLYIDLYSREYVIIKDLRVGSGNPKVIDTNDMIASINKRLAGIRIMGNTTVSQTEGLRNVILENNRKLSLRVNATNGKATYINLDDQCVHSGAGVVVSNKCCVGGICGTQESSFQTLSYCGNDDIMTLRCPDNRLISGAGTPFGYIEGSNSCSGSLCYEIASNGVIDRGSLTYNMSEFKRTCNSHYYTSMTVNCPTYESALVPVGRGIVGHINITWSYTNTVDISRYRPFSSLRCESAQSVITCYDENHDKIGSVTTVQTVSMDVESDDLVSKRLISGWTPSSTLHISYDDGPIEVKGYELSVEKREIVPLIVSSLGIFGLASAIYEIFKSKQTLKGDSRTEGDGADLNMVKLSGRLSSRTDVTSDSNHPD
jgi:hypothetical protein